MADAKLLGELFLGDAGAGFQFAGADGFEDRILRVAPDILPVGSIRIGQVWIDDVPYTNFDAEALQVTLPVTQQRVRVKVRIEPVVAPPHTNGVVKHAP